MLVAHAAGRDEQAETFADFSFRPRIAGLAETFGLELVPIDRLQAALGEL